MALKIYYKNTSGSYVAASQDDVFTNPIWTVHDGKNGDVKTQTLYLRNDESALWYSNIVITPADLDDPGGYDDTSYEDTGWGVKLSQGGTEPTDSEWDDIDWGNSITMSNVGSNAAGNIVTYYPFWYLITCPPNTDAQNKQDIALKVYYTENAVT